MTKKGLFEIYIPPSAEAKTLDKVDGLLFNKNELLLGIEENEYNLAKEQLEYLKLLLNLDISVFEDVIC